VLRAGVSLSSVEVALKNSRHKKRGTDEEVVSVMVKHRLVCPACEVYELNPVGRFRARCPGCGFELGGQMLVALLEILALPEALGTHACEECGHPQMRCLPDGVFHCPACHAEVTPIERRVAQL
jgi:ribosomal protein L37AE/L43A